MSRLFLDNRPYRTFRIRASSRHELNVEVVGSDRGTPVVFLHGGPGGGIEPVYYTLFDPARWRVVLLDQRGSGRSTPSGETRDNTTQLLTRDLEMVREVLGIDSWVVVGGSWGSTLALHYAALHPTRVRAMVLRSVFLATKSEMDWLYGGEGTSRTHPEAWAAFSGFIPEAERHDLVAAYYRRVAAGDSEAAAQWARFEAMTALVPEKMRMPGSAEPDWWKDRAYARVIAAIETHYFASSCFLREGELLDRAAAYRHIPGAIVHGALDSMCAPEVARRLKDAWPTANLDIVDSAPHTLEAPSLKDALVSWIARFEGAK